MQAFDFFAGEVAKLTRGDAVEIQKRIPDAHQATDRKADGFTHAPHLTIAPFMDCKFKPGMSTTVAHPINSGRSRDSVFELHPLLKSQGCLTGQVATHPDQVGFFNFVGWMGKTVRQGAIVGQKQQPGGCQIKAPYRVDPGGNALEEVGHHRPAGGITQRGNDPDRLVQKDVAQRFPDLESSTINFDPVTGRIGLVTKPCRAAIDGHPPGGYPLLGLATRAESRRSHQFLQTLH